MITLCADRNRIQSEYTRALQWDQMQAASRLSSQSGAGAATLPAPVVSGLGSAPKPPVDIEGTHSVQSCNHRAHTLYKVHYPGPFSQCVH